MGMQLPASRGTALAATPRDLSAAIPCQGKLQSETGKERQGCKKQAAKMGTHVSFALHWNAGSWGHHISVD